MRLRVLLISHFLYLWHVRAAIGRIAQTDLTILFD